MKADFQPASLEAGPVQLGPSVCEANHVIGNHPALLAIGKNEFEHEPECRLAGIIGYTGGESIRPGANEWRDIHRMACAKPLISVAASH